MMDKEGHKYKKALEELAGKVVESLAALDKVMKEHESPNRGRRVAKIANYLAMANDIAMHFELDWGFKKMDNFKKKITAKKK